jgi:hypothetical protein
MLATALSLGGDDASSQSAAWRQIVDIMAQAGTDLEPDARSLALARLESLRQAVPLAERRLAAASLAGRANDLTTAQLFSTDAPSVAAPFLSRMQLSDQDWGRILPLAPPASRNILRNRRDLPEVAIALLRHFAPGDLALPQSQIVAAEQGVSQIRDLVDRIAAYRQRVPLPTPEPAGAAVDASFHADNFLFETDADGVIDWVDDVPRGAIVGLTIAEPAPFGEGGVDGQASGAWRRRAPINDARLVIGGHGEMAGHWLISATPLFNPRNGRFCGYRGTARRPHAGEHVDGPAFVGLAPSSLRQIVHELRTPLNAIQGFAEMIDRQLLGPAALRYRERARIIMAETERLVAMVDDLDTAARIESDQMQVEAPASFDIARLAVQVGDIYRPGLLARGVNFEIRVSKMPLLVSLPDRIVERLFARLLAATTGVAAAGETIILSAEPSASGFRYSVSRPASLAGFDEARLHDPAYGPDGEWPEAPLLGLGFTLRLVVRMAAQMGGTLAILPDRFELTLRDSTAMASDKTG